MNPTVLILFESEEATHCGAYQSSGPVGQDASFDGNRSKHDQPVVSCCTKDP